MSRPLDEYDVPQFSKRALDKAVAAATAAERQRIGELALDEADRGAKAGLDPLTLRVFASRLLEGTPQPAGAEQLPSAPGPPQEHT